MEQRSLVILLEVSPDQIRGGYLRARMLQFAKFFQDANWKVTIGAPTALTEYDGFPCKQIRSRNLTEQLKGTSLALLFLSTHPHWMHLAHRAGVRVLLDASNLPWLERHEWLKRFPGLRNRLLDKVNHALMDESIRCADGVIISHSRQGDYIRARNANLRTIEWPFLQTAPIKASNCTTSLHKPYFVWGGGLWPWFDYKTLFEAIRIFRKKGGLGKVVIPVGATEFSSFQEDLLLQIDRDQSLRDSCVLLKNWLPREEWEDVLNGATAGMCCQPDTQETYFSFRTRVLDYFRIGLPVLSTVGDALGSLAATANAGLLHPFGGAEELAEQMLTLEQNVELRAQLSKAGQVEFAKLQADIALKNASLPRFLEILLEQRVCSAFHSRAKTASLLAIRFLL